MSGITRQLLINQNLLHLETLSKTVEALVSFATKGSWRYPVFIADKLSVSSVKVEVVELERGVEKREAIDSRLG